MLSLLMDTHRLHVFQDALTNGDAPQRTRLTQSRNVPTSPLTLATSESRDNLESLSNSGWVSFFLSLFLSFFFLKAFIFLSNLYTQRRARTHKSEIKNHKLYQLTQTGDPVNLHLLNLSAM